MIVRYISVCNHCKSKFILRVDVPKRGGDEFLFPCPICQIGLSGYFNKKIDTENELIMTSDFEIKIEKTLTINIPTITISVDIPVHRIFQSNILPKGGSPFLWLVQNMGENILEWDKQRSAFNDLYDKTLVVLKKLINHAELEDWQKVREILTQNNLIGSHNSQTKDQIIWSLFRVLNLLFVPIFKMDDMLSLLDEYYSYLNDCIENKLTEYRNALKLYKAQLGIDQIIKKLFNIYLRILKDVNPFYVGILSENMPGELKRDMKSYRLFRNDFDYIKGLFQDIFELNAKIMLFIACPVNLSVRGNIERFSTGINSFNRFNREKAFNKLKILDELPRLKIFYSKVSRPMRNNIGHFNAQYDYRDGYLLYENGERQNYIEFMGELLYALKSVWFMLIIIEKYEIDYAKFITT